MGDGMGDGMGAVGRPGPERTRALLEEQRATTLRRLAALRAQHGEFVDASRDTNADDEHDPEGATIAFERSQVSTLVRRAERRLGEVEAALARLAAGEYGGCEVCGRPIPAERLAVRPAAARCVACA